MSSIATVTKRGAMRVRNNGHLWIYRSDVLETRGADPGAIVTVQDENGNFVGKAFYSDRSEISLRILSALNEPIDREWWRTRIRGAIVRRRSLPNLETNAYRIIYAEGDLMPSLIVDRYHDVVVMQTLSQGTDKLRDMFVEILVEELAPSAVIVRNDAKVRRLEGLEQYSDVVHGSVPQEIVILQDGLRFAVDALGGQKTGSFLDQRENRVAARRHAFGRGLDCFTFNGAFALNLASKCESVHGLDISADAISTARRNAELNGLSNVAFDEANVFDALREFESTGEVFDTIVLDPPAFAKNRASVKAAVRGYKEVNLRALKLLSPGGILVTCTCSYHMSEDLFVEVVSAAAQDAKRRVQLVEKRSQAEDHPILLNMPETYYLKCLILRMLD